MAAYKVLHSGEGQTARHRTAERGRWSPVRGNWLVWIRAACRDASYKQKGRSIVDDAVLLHSARDSTPSARSDGERQSLLLSGRPAPSVDDSRPNHTPDSMRRSRGTETPTGMALEYQVMCLLSHTGSHSERRVERCGNYDVTHIFRIFDE